MNIENNTLENIDSSTLNSFNKNFLITIGIFFWLPSLLLLNLIVTDTYFAYNLYELSYSNFYYTTLNIVFIAFIFMDAGKMKNLGIDAPSKWWCLIPAVYLWKRANILKEAQTTFWIFMTMWGFSWAVDLILEIGYFEY